MLGWLEEGVVGGGRGWRRAWLEEGVVGGGRGWRRAWLEAGALEQGHPLPRPVPVGTYLATHVAAVQTIPDPALLVTADGPAL